jgi:hypothetical protein
MIDILNVILNAFGTMATAALALLPTDPLGMAGSPATGGLMGYAAYFLPLHEVGLILDALVAATLLWYVVRVALHWAKVAAG